MEACLHDGSSDPTNRNRIQGQRDVGHRAMDRDAHSHSDITRVNPAGPEPRTHRLTVGDLPACLPRLSRDGAIRRNGQGEVSRGRSSPLRQNAEGRFPRHDGPRAESFNPGQYRNNSMSDQRPQRTEEAKPPTTFWEMLEQLTPQVPRPDLGGEEVVQPAGHGEALPPPRGVASAHGERPTTRLDGTPHGTGVRDGEP
jgi:hypothetical protein